MDTPIKYSKIDLITSKDQLISFEDCYYSLSGNFLIIREDDGEHSVFNLEKIKQYKTYKS